MLSLTLSLTACHSNNQATSGSSANRTPIIPLTPATIPQIPLTPATIPQIPLIPATIPQIPLTPATIPQIPITPATSPQIPITPAKPAVSQLIILGGQQTLAQSTTSQLFSAEKLNDGTLKVITNSVTWISSDPSVATISSNGLVTGLLAGKTTITATYSDAVSNTYDLVISPIKSIKIINGDHGTPPNEKGFVLPKGATKQTRIMAILANGATTDITDQVTWSSTDKSIATVDKNGLITAVSPGSTFINARIKLAREDDTYTHASQKIQISKTDRFGVNAIYGDNSRFTSIKTPKQLVCLSTLKSHVLLDVTKYAQWNSSKPNIASIDSKGIVTGHKPGSTVITCTYYNGYIAYKMKFQNKKIVRIELHQGDQLVNNNPSGPILNDTTQIISPVTSVNYPSAINGQGISKNGFYPTAWAVYDDGSKENITKYASWWSNNQKAVYLNYLKGPYLFGHALAQNVLITASYAGLSASFKVNVEDGQAHTLSSMRIFLSDGSEIDKNITRDIHTYARLYVIGYYNDGQKKNISSNIHYSTNAPEYATVFNELNPNVLYFGWLIGPTTITATWQGIQKTFTATTNCCSDPN